jgi:hypothetical protein
MDYAKKMLVTTENLLNAVVQMPESDFERFLKKANALRKKQVNYKISRKESDLILKINTVFPTDKRERYNLLHAKSREETLPKSEHQELLVLNDEFEILNAKRIKYIGELAKIRRQTLEEVMSDLQIKTS